MSERSDFKVSGFANPLPKAEEEQQQQPVPAAVPEGDKLQAAIQMMENGLFQMMSGMVLVTVAGQQLWLHKHAISRLFNPYGGSR